MTFSNQRNRAITNYTVQRLSCTRRMHIRRLLPYVLSVTITKHSSTFRDNQPLIIEPWITSTYSIISRKDILITAARTAFNSSYPRTE